MNRLHAVHCLTALALAGAAGLALAQGGAPGAEAMQPGSAAAPAETYRSTLPADRPAMDAAPTTAPAPAATVAPATPDAAPAPDTAAGNVNTNRSCIGLSDRQTEAACRQGSPIDHANVPNSGSQDQGGRTDDQAG